MNDTSPEISAKISEMMATRTPSERLSMACDMFDTGKELIIAGLLRENGSLTKAQLRYRIFLRLYGDLFTFAEIGRIAETIPDMQADYSGSLD